MLIEQLHVENFRNLESLDIEPGPLINYFFGDNGAGKTSILESLSVLSRGRSFRTTQAGELAGVGGRLYRVVAAVREEEGNLYRVGLERDGSHWRGRVDGRDVAQLSQLSRMLPMITVEPDSHQLVSGAPEVRRRYLDWGMFHVERGFLDDWRRYSRALKQRNAALRNGQPAVLDSLDPLLAESGQNLSRYRERQTEQLAERIQGIARRLSPDMRSVDLGYRAGWKGESLLDALVMRREKDVERGMTSVGPHRADLAMHCGEVAARALLSRGEQKLLAVSMLLSQAELLAEQGKKPILLLDDLVSEFDQAHFVQAMDHVQKMAVQAWLTGTEKPVLECDVKMFHVEQGKVREVV